MKRILLLFVITIIATASLVSADTSAPQKIRIAAFNLYPTLFQAKDGSVQGFYVDFFSEIAKRENWTIEYVYGTWIDGLSRIKSGEVNVLTNVALTTERTQFMDYGKVPLLTVWAELFAPSGSPLDSIRVVGYQYKPDHFVASFVEITARKKAEESLRVSVKSC
jgi:two-component system cell cycle sensor histidine kinase/response regulator CckA